MFIINITVKDSISAEQHDKLFAEHTAWFKKHFDAGKFVMLGPYIDTQSSAGVIFAQTASREELDNILSEDSYFPDLADYDIREFAPKMISPNIVNCLA